METIYRWIRRHTWVDWVGIVAIGLLLQAFWACRMTMPSYMDAYYYATNAQRLAAGHGFSELIIWQFLDQPMRLPTPSHTYWMPLTSMVAAGGAWVIDGFRGLQLPFWLLAGSLPLLAYGISRDLSQARWLAWTAALLTATGGFYTRFFNQPSTFALFAWSGGACLWLLGRSSRSAAMRWGWLAAGIFAGLAHLTRADGVLLLLVGIGVAWVTQPALRSKLIVGALLLGGYLLVMGGWFAHNWQVLGRPLSTAGTQTIFLTQYDDLFAYGRSFNWADLQAWGWGNVLRSRLRGVSVAAQNFVAVNGLIFLTPFLLWGWLHLRRSRWSLLRPVTLYALVLYGAMSLAFTFPGMRGGLFHSSVALWPWAMALAGHGIREAVFWMGRRLPHWQPHRSAPIFAGLFVIVALLTSVGIGISRESTVDEAAVYTWAAAQLPDDAVVMAGNAPGFYYHTGLPSVSVPNEPVDVLLQAVAQYGVTHVLLDANRPQPLDDLYAGVSRPDALRLLAAWEDVKLYAIER